ncbi:MAG: aquaporin [Candidatus Saccharibacteria bacterium]
MFGRKQIAMIMAEFLGTGILTLVVLGVSKSSIGLPYFVSIAAGLVLVAMTLALGAVSGAQFNPAITIGLWTVRKVKSLPAIVYIAAQLLGGGAAYLLFRYFIGQSWQNSSHFDSKVLVGEAVGAFIFSLAWAAAAYQRLESGKAATVVGLGLTLGIIVASSASGGLLNPAVALGVRSWVWGSYVLGPVLGAIIGFNLYGLLFAPYATVMAETGTSTKKKK